MIEHDPWIKPTVAYFDISRLTTVTSGSWPLLPLRAASYLGMFWTLSWLRPRTEARLCFPCTGKSTVAPCLISRGSPFAPQTQDLLTISPRGLLSAGRTENRTGLAFRTGNHPRASSHFKTQEVIPFVAPGDCRCDPPFGVCLSLFAHQYHIGHLGFKYGEAGSHSWVYLHTSEFPYMLPHIKGHNEKRPHANSYPTPIGYPGHSTDPTWLAGVLVNFVHGPKELVELKRLNKFLTFTGDTQKTML